ncbi:hypothetical protein AB8879_06175 [Alphaproteobacteria bacterium LSUCC0744]
MDQTCPHCHKLVVLPELIRNYRNMPIRCHSCETAFFLPDEAVDKINGAVVKRRCESCKLSVYLPKLAHSNLSLRFFCPNCAVPLSFHRPSFLSSWRGIMVAGASGIAIGEIGFKLAPTSFDIAEGHTKTLYDMAITYVTTIKIWVGTLGGAS